MKRNVMEKLNHKIIEENKDKEIVLGDGNVNSKVILIGEAPGSKEVEYKKPFVGQAGKYLDEFLGILQIDREDLYITNTVKFRPTRKSSKTNKDINRAPNVKEIEKFKDYLFNEIEIIMPKIIVTLGNIPLKTLLKEKNVKISDLHGILVSTEINNNTYNVFPLYHPAAVIYKRELKDVYISDLRKLKRTLDEID